MKRASQLSRLDGYLRRQIHQCYTWISQGIREPLIQGDGQDQATKFYQLGDFPKRNRANPDFVILVLFDQFRVRAR